MVDLRWFRRVVMIVPIVMSLTAGTILPANDQASLRLRQDSHSDAPPERSLSEINVAPPVATGDTPEDLSRSQFSSTPAAWREPPVSVFFWAPTNLHHQPLYFDDLGLERYGVHARPTVQTFASAARFYGTIAVMPAKVLIDPPRRAIFTLGQQRPGSQPPCRR